MTSAEAALDGPHGTISVKWEVIAGHLRLQVEVPPDSEATIHLPSGVGETVGPGNHEWTDPTG